MDTRYGVSQSQWTLSEFIDCVKSQGLTNLLENLETTKNGNQIGKTEKFPVFLNLGWYKSWSNDVRDITTFLVFDSNTSTIVSRIPELWRPLLQFVPSSACWAQLLVSINCLSLIPIEPIGYSSLAFESPYLHTMKIAFGYEASQNMAFLKALFAVKYVQNMRNIFHVFTRILKQFELYRDILTLPHYTHLFIVSYQNNILYVHLCNSKQFCRYARKEL